MNYALTYKVMKKKNIEKLISAVLAALTVFSLSACGTQETEEVDFSGISSVCELATLKCYYHNVARAESEASGLLSIFGVGYKKIWVEYSGIVEFGIDVSKVTVSQPDENNVVTIAIPDAEVLSVDIDEDSISEPLVESGFLTTVTTEEETATLASAQDDMEETAAANTQLLEQAKERAKELIEGYVKNIGELIGEEYTVQWTDAETD